MSFFRRPDYTSDVTQFINQLRAKRPTLEAEQRAGRALLWDKNLNLAEQSEYLAARVAQHPYVYDTSHQANEK
ncbi:MAG: acetyl-CoA carboxyl transferase [Burkholderiales bacterium RIFCSPHIGHO2_12_FULL_61_11]|nr:MAG: acetyl-CoA carboxyl transferase [Burkholderiales bacterium RIFCSPHIGHO2_12_FULL_61_11]